MALPQQLKTARMTNATPAATIDNEVGNLEQAIADILGLPTNTDITQKLFTGSASGPTELFLKSPLGTVYKVSVDDNGALVTTPA